MSAWNASNLFNLQGRSYCITGGEMLGYQHAATIADLGGTPVLMDINPQGLEKNREQLQLDFGNEILALMMDITNLESVERSMVQVLERYGQINVSINNAARNPKVEDSDGVNFYQA